MNKYGANLAAASLSGYLLMGSPAYATPIHLMQDIMKLGGIFLEKEATNVLLNKISDPFILAYIEHLTNISGP